MARHRVRFEEWGPVLGYEGLYEISLFGRCRRIGAAKGARVGLILKPKVQKNGYMYFDLCKNGKHKRKTIYRAVCETFHDKQPTPKHEPNHKNGDLTNNTFWNLEWNTHKENCFHRNHILKKDIKSFLVIDPFGNKTIIHGLAKFCRENSLSTTGMSAVACGRINNHKGWRCEHYGLGTIL